MRAAWLALTVPALGLLELAAHFAFARRAPTLDEWRGVRGSVAELRGSQGLVVVAPHWAEPLARHAFGDELMPLDEVARPDESGFARAVEVSLLGRSAPELAGWRSVEERRAGRFRLRVLENPSPVRVLFDFVEHVAPPHLSAFHAREAGGERQPCAWNPRARVSNGGLGGNPTFPARRFECPGGEYFFVGVTVIDDQHEYRPRRCIWAHPPEHGSLLLRFAAVPLGAVVRGHAGLPWLIHRDGSGTPVELRVRVGGREIGRVLHHDVEGWKRFELPTGAAGRREDVELEVSSERAAHRHFCFQADTR
jgi:hypothetical protein